MKVKGIVTLENCIFIQDQTNKNLPDGFEDYFCKKKNNITIKQEVLKMYCQMYQSKTHHDVHETL